MSEKVVALNILKMFLHDCINMAFVSATEIASTVASTLKSNPRATMNWYRKELVPAVMSSMQLVTVLIRCEKKMLVRDTAFLAKRFFKQAVPIKG